MRTLFKLCLMALCAFLALTLCSCNFMTKEEIVDFELPEWPEYLPELKGWKVQVFYSEALRQAQGPQCYSITFLSSYSTISVAPRL